MFQRNVLEGLLEGLLKDRTAKDKDTMGGILRFIMVIDDHTGTTKKVDSETLMILAYCIGSLVAVGWVYFAFKHRKMYSNNF